MLMAPRTPLLPARKRKHRLLVGRVSKVRSKNMSAIRSRDTKPELLLRKALSARGLRYKLHRRDLPGCPDIVFHAQKLAVFCDGDFWHGRGWQARKVKGFRVRTAYWVQKIDGNIKRDRRNRLALRKLGWTVLRFWASDVQRRPAAISDKVALVLATRSDAGE